MPHHACVINTVYRNSVTSAGSRAEKGAFHAHGIGTGMLRNSKLLLLAILIIQPSPPWYYRCFPIPLLSERGRGVLPPKPLGVWLLTPIKP